MHLISIQDNLDTTTSIGRLMFHIVSSFAEYERDLISERTIAGLKATKARGTKLGRRYQHLDKFKNLFSKGCSKKEIMKKTKMSKATYYRLLKLIKDDKDISVLEVEER